MTVELTHELVEALRVVGASGLEVIDPETQRKYLLVDSNIHRRAMEALQREQDREAIATGLAQMQAGMGKPLDQAFAEMQKRLGA